MPYAGFALQWNHTFPFPPPILRTFSSLPRWEARARSVGPPVPRFNPDLPVELRDVVAMTIQFVLGEDRFLTRSAWVSNRPGNAGYDPTGFVAAHVAGLLAAWRLAASEQIGFDTVVVERLNLPAELPGVFVFDPVADGQGSVADDVLPPQVAVAINHNTSIRSQKGRGTVYFPGAAEMHNDQGFMSAAGQTLWGAVANALESTITVAGDGTYTPVIAKRVITGDPALTTVRASPVIRAELVTTYSQRATRRIGRGM